MASWLSITVLFGILAMVVLGFNRSRQSGGVLRALGTTIAFVAALAAFALLFAHPRYEARHVTGRGYSIGSDPSPGVIRARTQQEHDRLVEIRGNAVQPDVMRAHISGGQGFEIYSDGMIFHYSQGRRELFRDPGLVVGQIASNGFVVKAQTPHELELLKEYRVSAPQPDGDGHIHGGEGFETYPGGMVIHVSSGNRTLFRDGELPHANDQVVQSRLAARQPSAKLQRIATNRFLESYPDGMRVLFDSSSQQRSLISQQDWSHEPAHHSGRPSVSVEPSVSVALIIVMLTMGALLLSRRRRGAGQGAGFGWVAVGAVLLVVAVVGWSYTSTQTRPVAQVAESVDNREVSLNDMWDRINTPTIQLEPAADAAHADSAEPSAVASNATAPDAPAEEQSIESSDSSSDESSTETQSAHQADDHARDADDEAEPQDEEVDDDAENQPTADGDQHATADSASEELSTNLPVDVAADAPNVVHPSQFLQVAASTSAHPHDSPNPLRVAFEDVPEWRPESSEDGAAGPKPDWVLSPPQRVGKSDQRVVKSGLYKTVDECFVSIAPLLEQQTIDRLNSLIRRQYDQQRPNVSRVRLTTAEILREFCQQQYVETQDTSSVGPMKQLYVLMSFDRDSDRYLLQRWTNIYRVDRLIAVAAAAGAVVGLMSLFYGLLKLDTWTRGYYTKRLFIGVPAAIMVFVLLVASMS